MWVYTRLVTLPNYKIQQGDDYLKVQKMGIFLHKFHLITLLHIRTGLSRRDIKCSKDRQLP